MARQSEFDAVLAKLNADIDKLQETRELLLRARDTSGTPAKPKRTRKAKAAKSEPEL